MSAAAVDPVGTSGGGAVGLGMGAGRGGGIAAAAAAAAAAMDAARPVDLARHPSGIVPALQ
jgi:transcription initiation factor TFIID TATA-box-binding protein